MPKTSIAEVDVMNQAIVTVARVYHGDGVSRMQIMLLLPIVDSPDGKSLRKVSSSSRDKLGVGVGISAAETDIGPEQKIPLKGKMVA